jgi:hypothetical protein
LIERGFLLREVHDTFLLATVTLSGLILARHLHNALVQRSENWSSMGHIAHGHGFYFSWETAQNIWLAPILHQQSEFHFSNGFMPSSGH